MFKLIALTVLLGLAVADHIDHDAETKSFTSDITPEGSFSYSYETSNGIVSQVSGDANHIGGSFKYVSPEGTPVELTYTADENGYQPHGTHLPIGPEIPEAIVRALEYIKTHPSKE